MYICMQCYKFYIYLVLNLNYEIETDYNSSKFFFGYTTYI